ncbi:type II toxin-antitoxin system RelE/ParE family toxin [Balneolaceae bacterium ANBcel3]|nr:type II toxin-antitoxin system RelE/ParE family toxin [Balneolaceae bacterium ANBcel3]
MAQIIWTEPALYELDEIADYISLDNPKAAKNLVRSVFKRVAQLHEHLKSRKHVENLEESIYHRLLVSPCQIFYREERNGSISSTLSKMNNYYILTFSGSVKYLIKCSNTGIIREFGVLPPHDNRLSTPVMRFPQCRVFVRCWCS